MVLRFQVVFQCVALISAIALAGCQATGERPADSDAGLPGTRLDSGKLRLAHGAGTPLLGKAQAGDSAASPAHYLGTGAMVGQNDTRRSRIPGDGEPTITLNIVDVPIVQAAKTILGDSLGLNYTVGPTLAGTITLQTAKPVSRGQLLALFETALRGSGAALVETGGNYAIVPADQAAGSQSRIQSGGAAGSGNIGSGIEVIQLKFVSASEMRRVLEPIAQKGGIVRADDNRNVLMLSGTAQDIATMREAIDLFDIDVMKGKSISVVPVRSSQPDALADELRVVFSADGDGPLKGVVQFLPNKRLGAILVISTQARYLARAEAWIRRLDAHAQGSEKQLFVYNVQNRAAKELAGLVQSMFPGETAGAAAQQRSVAPRFQAAGIQSAEAGVAPGAFAKAASGAGGAAFPGTGGLRGITGTSAETGQRSQPVQDEAATRAGAQGLAGGDDVRLRITSDDANNSLLVMATSADYKRVMRVIESLDVVPNQVLIEATIAEVSLNDDLKFGVQWYFQGQRSSNTFTDLASGTVASAFPGFSYALKAASIQATLNALNAVTNVNIISSPSLMVLDNKTATLQLGDQVPIATQSAVGTVVAGSPIVNSIQLKDTGVILSVTPRINESGRVLLEVEQEVSSVVKTTTSNIDSPTIRQRRVKTTVLVNDGEVLALGGLIQDKESVGRSQVPILGDIPLLGNIFRQKENTIDKTELIILITPHVVRDLNEARRVTEEFRRKMAVYIPHVRGIKRDIAHTARRTFE